MKLRRKPKAKPRPIDVGNQTPLEFLNSMRDQVLLGLIPAEEYEAKKKELYGRS